MNDGRIIQGPVIKVQPKPVVDVQKKPAPMKPIGIQVQKVDIIEKFFERLASGS